MKDQRLNKLIKISLLGAIAFLLMFIEFALPIFPNFLKVDISDLPALIGAFALGPVAGVTIEFLKNILHLVFKNNTMGVGELANFLVGAILVFTSGIIYKRNKTKNNALISVIIGTIAMTIGAAILNYFVFLPLYETVLHFPIKAVVGMGTAINPNIKNLNTFIIWAIIPFNLLKAIIVSVITLLMYKRISPILHK
jgi:riboflavin transporter